MLKTDKEILLNEQNVLNWLLAETEQTWGEAHFLKERLKRVHDALKAHEYKEALTAAQDKVKALEVTRNRVKDAIYILQHGDPLDKAAEKAIDLLKQALQSTDEEG